MAGRRASRAGSRWLGSHADGPWHTRGAAAGHAWPPDDRRGVSPRRRADSASASRPRGAAAAVRPGVQASDCWVAAMGGRRAAPRRGPRRGCHRARRGPGTEPPRAPELVERRAGAVSERLLAPDLRGPRATVVSEGRHATCAPASRRLAGPPPVTRAGQPWTPTRSLSRGVRRRRRDGGRGVPTGCRGRPFVGAPLHRDHARSYRSRFMTLFHAATKSRTNPSSASSHA